MAPTRGTSGGVRRTLYTGILRAPLFGMQMVRRIVERRFRAMVEEIVRRDALARGRPKD